MDGNLNSTSLPPPSDVMADISDELAEFLEGICSPDDAPGKVYGHDIMGKKL